MRFKEVDEVKEINEVQETKTESIVDKIVEQYKGMLNNLKGKIPLDLYNAMKVVNFDIISRMKYDEENYLRTDYMKEDLLEDTRQLLSRFAEQLGIDKVHEIQELEKNLANVNFVKLIGANFGMLKTQVELVEKNGRMKKENYCAKKEDRDETIECMNRIFKEVCEVGKDTPRFGVIQLPTELAEIVRKILDNEHQIKVKGDYFSREELQLIEKIKIQNPNSKSKYIGFELLPNLSSLEITTQGQTEILPEELIHSISQESMESIEKCKGLKKLIIENQDKIDKIDVSKMQGLEELSIIHNHSLKKVNGLETLNQLSDLNLYGNDRLIAPHELDSVILNNDLWSLNLDVLLFPNAIGFDTKSKEYRKDVFDKMKEISHLEFVEKIGGSNNTVNLNLKQMVQIHNTSCRILSEIIRPNSTNHDIIISVQDYLARMVKYDHDGLKNGHVDKYNHQNRTNSLYNALIQNSAVCEGYVSAMQYLLKLKGIRSHKVTCVLDKDVEFISNPTLENLNNYMKRQKNNDIHTHSIICIDGVDKYYADPTSNATYYQNGNKSMPFALCTKEKIEKFVNLSVREREVVTAERPNAEILKNSIRNSQLFIDSKISDLIKAHGKINEDRAKGEIDIGEEGLWYGGY